MTSLVDLPLLTVATLVAAAFVAGWIDSVVGGGGLVQLPSLLIALPNADVPTVSGTNKLSSVAGTSVATATYLRTVPVDWRVGIPLMVCAYLGSTGGAQIVRFLPRAYFNPIVLATIVVVGWYTWRRPALGMGTEFKHDGWGRWLRAAAIGLAVGLWDGILGPGTGTLFVILLVAVIGYGFLEATVLAKLGNLTTNVAAILVFGTHHQVMWALGGCMAVANLSGGAIGARMAIRHGNGFVRKVFLVVIVGLGLKLAVDIVRQVG